MTKYLILNSNLIHKEELDKWKKFYTKWYNFGTNKSAFISGFTSSSIYMILVNQSHSLTFSYISREKSTFPYKIFITIK